MQPDLLIGLGKNIGIDSKPEDIQRHPLHLSRDSRLTVLATGILWRPGMDILFSTGQTAGPDVPAEADAMDDYLGLLFPDIPTANRSRDIDSYDTASNAKEVADDLTDKSYRHIDLLSVGYHVVNAATLFRRAGVAIENTHASEEVVREASKRYALSYFETYIDAWENSARVEHERQKEMVRRALLATIDPHGHLLQLITRRSRRP